MSLFITFEGGEGTGKSIQSKLLKEHLESLGYSVFYTREPGGTELGEKIRKVLLTGEPDKMTDLTEALLYLASRSDHWSQKIKPALDAGQVVICDRFHDSSLVYQGYCKGVDQNFLNEVLSEITKGRTPDRTYLIDLDPEIGVKRSLARAGNFETRFEKMELSFHQKVREGFLNLAENNTRFKVIDGSQSIKQIAEIIRADIQQVLS